MDPTDATPEEFSQNRRERPVSRVLKRAFFWFLALLVLVMLIRWFEYKQVYHPTRSLWATPAEAGLPFEEVTLRTTDGLNLDAWFIPARETSDQSNLAFLVCHGNGGNLSHRIPLMELLHGTGAAVLAFDYRGYGRSEGRPSEEGTYLDAQAAWSWLHQRGFSGENILVWGESLGGAVAAELALRERCGAVVLQSTFTSIPDMGKQLYPFLPVDWLATIHYDTRSKLGRIDVPVLIMHSRSDGIIPFSHAEKNLEAAGEPKLLWEIEGGHNDQLVESTALFKEGITKLLQLVNAKKAKE